MWLETWRRKKMRKIFFLQLPQSTNIFFSLNQGKEFPFRNSCILFYIEGVISCFDFRWNDWHSSQYTIFQRNFHSLSRKKQNCIEKWTESIKRTDLVVDCQISCNYSQLLTADNLGNGEKLSIVFVVLFSK